MNAPSKSVELETTPALTILTTDLRELIEALTANLGLRGLSTRNLPRITVPTGGEMLWKLPTLDDEALVPSIQGVIVKSRNERAYYAGRTRSPRPPDCASNDALMGTGAPGGDCRTCRLAQFGSGPAGGQACRRFTRLLFLPCDWSLPAVVTVPPMSVAGYEAFVFSAGIRNREAIIEVGLTGVKNASGKPYAKVTFRLVRRLDAAEIERLGQWVRAVWPPRPPKESGVQARRSQ
jgi:hypothetical protein